MTRLLIMRVHKRTKAESLPLTMPRFLAMLYVHMTLAPSANKMVFWRPPALLLVWLFELGPLFIAFIWAIGVPNFLSLSMLNFFNAAFVQQSLVAFSSNHSLFGSFFSSLEQRCFSQSSFLRLPVETPWRMSLNKAFFSPCWRITLSSLMTVSNCKYKFLPFLEFVLY